MVSQKGNTPAYYYEYSHVRPAPLLLNGAANSNQVSGARGAVHSAEIEYALGNLSIQPAYHWQADDHKVSALMQEYFANFIKTGNPNGDGLPTWPLFTDNQRLNINLDPYVEDIQHLRKRYEFHRQYYFNER